MRTNDYSKSVGSSSTRILEPNPNRHYACFINDSDEVIYLALGQSASGNIGIRLNASGGSYEINIINPYHGYIEAICASGGKNLCVIEVSHGGQ